MIFVLCIFEFRVSESCMEGTFQFSTMQFIGDRQNMDSIK